MTSNEDGARISRDRCLNALEGCTDQKKGQSLWKAARRYNCRMRDEAAAALVIAGPPLARHSEWGSYAGTRELV